MVVLTDIHANGRALRRALEIARRHPEDEIVILGDLLTYGVDVDEVLDMVAQAQDVSAAKLLLGNHDQLYIDLAAGDRSYYEGLPDWIKESVDYTLEHLDVPAFRTGLRWETEVVRENVLLAHANPYSYGDWRYLNSAEEHASAGEALSARGLSAGIFGHTHRAKLFDSASPGTIHDLADGRGTVRLSPAAPVILNPGSVGQPRNEAAMSSILRLRATPTTLEYESIPLDYDAAAHVAGLYGSSLSRATCSRLSAFFGL